MLVVREETAPALTAANSAAKSTWDAIASFARLAVGARTREGVVVWRVCAPRCPSGPPLPRAAN